MSFNFALVTETRLYSLHVDEQAAILAKIKKAEQLLHLQYIPDKAHFEEAAGIHMAMMDLLEHLNEKTDSERSSLYALIQRSPAFVKPGMYDNNFRYIFPANDISLYTGLKVVPL
jgi:hypothetical protein